MKTLVKGKISGESRVWVHSQTLDQKGRKWRYGRAWLNFGQKRTLGITWKHGGRDKTFGVSLAVRHFDNLISFSLWLPFLFFWSIHYEAGRCYFDQERELSLRVFGGKLWWHLWMPIDEWRRTDPRWRRGAWGPLDAPFGREVYSETEISRGLVAIDMPEGSYQATYKAYDAQWKRSRWPFAKRSTRYDFEMVMPIPVPGRGENSWDMEDDATYGASLHCDSLNGAVERFRASVLRQREQYGGPNWQPAAEEGEA